MPYGSVSPSRHMRRGGYKQSQPNGLKIVGSKAREKIVDWVDRGAKSGTRQRASPFIPKAVTKITEPKGKEEKKNEYVQGTRKPEGSPIPQLNDCHQ